nr:unnamed protein product [Digitaria exilis]
MEKGGHQSDKNEDHLDLNVGTDPSHQEPKHDGDVVVDPLGDEDDAHTDPEDEDYIPRRKRSKRMKRHTVEQTKELMDAYDQCTHPDRKTQQALGTKLGLKADVVKFWFQNKRTQMKKRSQVEQNEQMYQENASLLAENTALRKALLTKSCITCGGERLPTHPPSEKQHLLEYNSKLKDEYLRASCDRSKTVHASTFRNSTSLAIKGRAEYEAVIRLAEMSMEHFMVLATKGEPLWLPATDGEMLNAGEYTRIHPCVYGLRHEGYVVEATRDAANVWGSADHLVHHLMNTALWSEMFPGIVASMVAGDDIASISAPYDGKIQLMNAELCVQSPRVPNRTMNILRFSKLIAERQWAVVDVSVDSIFGQQVMPARYMGCRLLPSGCLIEDMNNGYCKVTWIVHAEYDESTVPMLFKPLFLTGQALGARRWLAAFQRQLQYMVVLYSSSGIQSNNTAAAGGILKLAEKMTASFYRAISGTVTPTQTSSSINEWIGSKGAGVDKFDVAVRMATWMKTGSVAGDVEAGLVLSATTTLWLPSVQPQRVFDYLCDGQLRGQWDVLANGAAVKQLTSIATGPLGNAVSVLCPNNIKTGVKAELVLPV